jgi:hypothetical protein
MSSFRILPFLFVVMVLLCIGCIGAGAAGKPYASTAIADASMTDAGSGQSPTELESCRGGGGRGRGERKQAAKPTGTDNPFKKMRPHPTKANMVLYTDPHTGKEVEKPKPAGFDEWWNQK